MRERGREGGGGGGREGGKSNTSTRERGLEAKRRRSNSGSRESPTSFGSRGLTKGKEHPGALGAGEAPPRSVGRRTRPGTPIRTAHQTLPLPKNKSISSTSSTGTTSESSVDMNSTPRDQSFIHCIPIWTMRLPHVA